jgi:plastocyanin
VGDPLRSLLSPPVIVALAIFAGSAYGGAGASPGAASSGGGLGLSREAVVRPGEAAVTMTDKVIFEPQTVTVKAGQTVAWKNTSRLVHTVTADPAKAATPSHVQLPDGAETFDSGAIRPGETYRRTFTVPGTYRYFCIPHEAAGMVGEIVVEE